MKLKILFLFLLITNSFEALQGKDNYINKFDLETASAIVNNSKTVLEIKSISRAKVTKEYDITILKESGNAYGAFHAFEDDFRRLNFRKAEIFNMEGEKIKTIRANDLEENNINAAYTLFDDNYLKYYIPQMNDYPYRVKYEYSIHYNGLLSYPSWKPQKNNDIFVKNSTFKVITKDDFTFRYLNINTNVEPEIKKDRRKKIYKWNLQNIESFAEEPYSPVHEYPLIMLAPNDFEIDNYAGKMNSWENFGLWIKKLLNEKNEIPEKTITEIRELTDTLDTFKEKVNAVYQYVQNKTRYVSIQLGIGGWQPFKAEKVDELGYGDCKALSNYTKNLLDSIGIEAYYTIIRSNENPNVFIEDFPSNQFNHVIVCALNKKDTLWLETTSAFHPTGYLSKSTSNRKALLISKEGGKLVPTPSYSCNDNYKLQFIKLNISKNGHANAKIQTRYHGLRFDDFLRQEIKSNKKQKEWLNKNLDINNFKIKDFDYSSHTRDTVLGSRKISLNIKNYGTKTGNRIFIPLNTLNKISTVPQKLEKRRNPVSLNNAFYDKDTIEITIPEGYRMEYLPQDIEHYSDFGSYVLSIKKSGKKVFCCRKLKFRQGTFPPEKYKDLRDFFKTIVKGDKQKMVLVKE